MNYPVRIPLHSSLFIVICCENTVIGSLVKISVLGVLLAKKKIVLQNYCLYMQITDSKNVLHILVDENFSFKNSIYCTFVQNKMVKLVY